MMAHINFKQSMRVLSLSLVAALTTACSTTSLVGDMPMATTFPIEVAESIERLELYTRVNGLDLSARDQDAVALFLRGYAQHGDGPIFMNVPSNAATGIGTRQARNTISAALSGLGVPGSALRTGQYQVAAQAPAPVVISYRRLKTLPRDCKFMDRLTFTGSNRPYAGYGCSHSANLAAMIQDPRQLIEPYDFTSPNSQRRMVVYDKYINGENTASEQPDRQEVSAEDR